MTRPLINARTVQQSALGREVAQYDDRESITETATGVVTAVYPVDHPENFGGQLLVDVLMTYSLAAYRYVPVCAVYAHQETEIATAMSTNRQPYTPKKRNRMEGTVFDLRPGTKVRVGFIDNNSRAPVVTGTMPFNRQGEGGYPGERQTVDLYDGSGKKIRAVEMNPLHSRMAEYPRTVESRNGTVHLIDNKGNDALQTTTDQESNFPGHNGIPAAPQPEGNITRSTRGARMGNQARVTGRHPQTGETNSHGSIRDETHGAKIGNCVRRLVSEIGRIYESTRGSGDGRAYYEDKNRSYLSLLANGKAEFHANDQATIDADEVCLGNNDPPYHATLWEPLDDIITELVNIFDSHGHTEVQSGNSVSGPPDLFQSGVWLQRKTECKSDHVRLVKDEGATPHTQNDPDGEDGGVQA